MKKIEYGIKNVHFALRKYNTETGAVTYEKPIAIPYARSTDLAPQGDASKIYADNIMIYNALANQGYNGSLAFTAIQDIIYEKFLNYLKDTNGNLLEDADAKSPEFAMMFEFENDVKATRYIFYRCTLTRPNVSSSTKEKSINVDDKTLTISVLPDDELISGKTIVKAHTTENTSAEAYANWYENVSIPEIAPAA